MIGKTPFSMLLFALALSFGVMALSSPGVGDVIRDDAESRRAHMRVTLTIPARSTLVPQSGASYCLKTNALMPVRAVIVTANMIKRKEVSAHDFCDDASRQVVLDAAQAETRDGKLIKVVALEPQ